MNDKVIDTLELKITVNNRNVVNKINDTTTALQNLHNTLQNIDLGKLSQLSDLFSKIGNMGEGAKAISSLNTRLRTLNNNLAKIDTSVFKSKFAEMTAAITPFIDKINSAQESLVALNGVMGGAKTLTKANKPIRTPKSGGKMDKLFSIGSLVGKLYFVKNVSKQLGQSMAKVVQYGIDYEETLNLWQVAMRGNISQARTFVSEMNRAYGVSEATLMNYQAIFRNMLSALGNISEASSYAISESLTQMALDFSSLYNTSVEEAMTKFQAVLSGQVRPIRTAGYDITEQTLFQLYQQLGGTKTVRQLNQTEKQLLRILAVFQQMDRVGATGDLKKTITSTANQMRIMKEQGKDFATWVGISLNLLLQESEILLEINGYLIALKELAKSIAYDLGYKEKNFMVEFAEGAEDANKEVDKLKGKLLGFDKFQVLNSAGNEDVGIEQTLLDALGAYDSILNGFENPAVAKAEEHLKNMGFHMEEIKDESGEVVGYIWKANKGEETALEKLKQIGRIAGGLLFLVGAIFKPWMIVVAAIETAYFTNENFRNSVNSLIKEVLITSTPVLDSLFSIFASIVKSIEPVVVNTLQALVLMLPIIDKIAIAVNWVVEKSAKLPFVFSPVVTFCEIWLKILQSIVELVRALFEWDWDSLGDNLEKIWKHSNMQDLIDGKGITLTPTKKAEGGLATKGSLFYAGEVGPELVTQTSGGNSTVMNMRQLEDAVARGFIRGFASTDNGYEDNDTTQVYVDGQRLFNIMRGTAKRNGYDFVKV